MTKETDTAVTLPILGELQYLELHAFEHGLYSGAVEGSRGTAYRTGKERHYWRMAYLLGMLGRYVVVALAGVGLVEMYRE